VESVDYVVLLGLEVGDLSETHALGTASVSVRDHLLEVGELVGPVELPP
jgi:hypothetical protein